METTEDLGKTHIFERKGGLTGMLFLYVIGGAVAGLFALFGFSVAMFGDVGQFQLHAMTTFPILISLSALTTAWRMAQTAQRVIVHEKGILIEGRKDHQAIYWEEIGWCTIVPLPMNARKRNFILYDTRGKTLVKLGETFTHFDAMAEVIKAHVAAEQQELADALQLKKARRSAIFITSVSMVLFLVACANVVMAYTDQQAQRKLAEEAVPGKAEIVRRFLAPNGVTCRLEYTVTDADGTTGTRNAEVTASYWDRLEDASEVDVMYVPGSPKISRLVEGEPEKNDPTDNPLVMYGLSGLILLLCIFFWVAAILQWRGWDIDLDSKTGKISIKRFGTGR